MARKIAGAFSRDSCILEILDRSFRRYDGTSKPNRKHSILLRIQSLICLPRTFYHFFEDLWILTVCSGFKPLVGLSRCIHSPNLSKIYTCSMITFWNNVASFEHRSVVENLQSYWLETTVAKCWVSTLNLLSLTRHFQCCTNTLSMKARFPVIFVWWCCMLEKFSTYDNLSSLTIPAQI